MQITSHTKFDSFQWTNCYKRRTSVYDHCDGISHVRYISTGEKHALLKSLLDIVVETEYCGNDNICP